MSSVGVCFTPRVHIKQIIEQLTIMQAVESFEVFTDEKSYTTPPPPPPAALLRISPIAYFYANHSPSVRLEVIKNCAQAMFGAGISIDMFTFYIELLVRALNGQSKEEILGSIQLPSDQDDPITVSLIKLVDLLRNDNNDIKQGVKKALTFNQPIKKECKWLNPFDSNETLIVTLYLQVGGALYYQMVPSEWLDRVYSKEILVSLAKWLEYVRQLHQF